MKWNITQINRMLLERTNLLRVEYRRDMIKKYGKKFNGFVYYFEDKVVELSKDKFKEMRTWDETKILKWFRSRV